MARCSKCNTSNYKRLTEEEIKELFDEGQIPSSCKVKVSKYYMCMGCKKVFWKGPKYDSARVQIASVLQMNEEDVYDEDGQFQGYVDGLEPGKTSAARELDQ
mmetsp:Transcript_13806/g.47767  ORF Transcript_13806/g.47767 Transcript_13806/m.47767 type:complete len:102 (-) Transcript_13806:85-390(-)